MSYSDLDNHLDKVDKPLTLVIMRTFLAKIKIY